MVSDQRHGEATTQGGRAVAPPAARDEESSAERLGASGRWRASSVGASEGRVEYKVHWAGFGATKTPGSQRPKLELSWMRWTCMASREQASGHGVAARRASPGQSPRHGHESREPPRKC